MPPYGGKHFFAQLGAPRQEKKQLFGGGTSEAMVFVGKKSVRQYEGTQSSPQFVRYTRYVILYLES